MSHSTYRTCLKTERRRHLWTDDGTGGILQSAVVVPPAPCRLPLPIGRKEGGNRRQWDIRKTPTRSFFLSFFRRICNFARSLGTLTIKRERGDGRRRPSRDLVFCFAAEHKRRNGIVTRRGNAFVATSERVGLSSADST